VIPFGSELRRLAHREPDRAAARMYAIANALEGMAGAEAARLAGLYNMPHPSSAPWLERRAVHEGTAARRLQRASRARRRRAGER